MGITASRRTTTIIIAVVIALVVSAIVGFVIYVFRTRNQAAENKPHVDVEQGITAMDGVRSSSPVLLSITQFLEDSNPQRSQSRAPQKNTIASPKPVANPTSDNPYIHQGGQRRHSDAPVRSGAVETSLTLPNPVVMRENRHIESPTFQNDVTRSPTRLPSEPSPPQLAVIREQRVSNTSHGGVVSEPRPPPYGFMHCFGRTYF